MKSKLFCLSAAAVALGVVLSTSANASIAYVLDDGSPEYLIGLDSAGDITFANRFVAAAGGTRIQNIEIFWGDESRAPIGLSMTAKLWSDPNGDGNPSDAVLLTSAAGQVTANWIFVVYDIPDVVLAVGQSFFVGATVTQTAGNQRPFGLDTSSPVSNNSWTAVGSDIVSGAVNLGNEFGLSSDVMIRANGVPEPGTLALMSLALVGLGAALRRRH